MKLLTLQRQAPVAPDAAECRLCDAPIAGTLQDHLLAGQPGTTQLELAICQRCGERLRRLVEVFGPELCFVVEDRRQAVEHLIGGPAARKAIARSQAERADPAPPRDHAGAVTPAPDAGGGPAGAHRARKPTRWPGWAAPTWTADSPTQRDLAGPHRVGQELNPSMQRG